MLPSPAPKPVQARTTIPHSPRKLRTTRPVALAPNLRRHLHPPSGQAIHHRLKNFRRRLRRFSTAQPTHLHPISPPHPSLIGQAITPTAMPAQPVTHRPHNLQVHERIVSRLRRSVVKRSPISMDPMPPPPPVEASTKPRRKSRLRPRVGIRRRQTGSAAAVARSASVSQATNPIVPLT